MNKFILPVCLGSLLFLTTTSSSAQDIDDSFGSSTGPLSSSTNSGVGIKVEGGDLNFVEYFKVVFSGDCPGESKKKPYKARFYFPALFNKTPKPGVEFKKVILKNIASGQIKEKKFPDKKGLPGISDDFKVRWDKDLKIQNGTNTILYSFKVKVDGKERIIDGGQFDVFASTKNIEKVRNATTESEIVCENPKLSVGECDTRTVTKVQKVCRSGGFFGKRKVLETRYVDSHSVFQDDNNSDPFFGGADDDFGSPEDWE